MSQEDTLDPQIIQRIRNKLEELNQLVGSANLATMNNYKDYQKLVYKKMNINDDHIAQVIKNPTPPSVSDVLYTIGKKSDQQRGSIRGLDLSENYITSEGATQLFDKILGLLPNLEIIDLSYNRLRDSKENTTFDVALGKILCSSLKSLNLRGNHFGHDWYAHIQQQLGLEMAHKIKKSI